MAVPLVERRLAAILAADVVGYTRLIELDEAGTLARLKRLRQEVIEPILARHGGRIVKLLGDGALVEFGSAAAAVQAAVEVQQAVAAERAERREAAPIRFRIGISLGDVVHEDDDVFGEGVNLASRLEALADPGGICLSGAVVEQARNRVPVGLVAMGRQRLKNIAEPVEVWRVAPDGATTRRWLRHWRSRSVLRLAAALLLLVGIGLAGWWWQRLASPPTSATPPMLDRPAIAVLPFDDLGGEERQQRLADGFTEDLITELARSPELMVIARNSVGAFQGSARGRPRGRPQARRALRPRGQPTARARARPDHGTADRRLYGCASLGRALRPPARRSVRRFATRCSSDWWARSPATTVRSGLPGRMRPSVDRPKAWRLDLSAGQRALPPPRQGRQRRGPATAREGDRPRPQFRSGLCLSSSTHSQDWMQRLERRPRRSLAR